MAHKTLVESLKKCKVEGNIVHLPPIDEPLANYSEVRKALLNAGAKYKKCTFVFNSDAQPFIDRLCSGESVNIKKEFQFFETPDDIADWLVGLADLRENHNVLEPSAGQGAIVKAINRKYPELKIDCFELMKENASIISKMDNCILLDYDFINTAYDSIDRYDRIIANPPFTKNQDIDHITKMHSLLADGGRLVSVASKHWQLSGNKKEVAFKKWLGSLNADIIDISAGKFKESGTMISCCIIVINKE